MCQQVIMKSSAKLCCRVRGTPCRVGCTHVGISTSVRHMLVFHAGPILGDQNLVN